MALPGDPGPGSRALRLRRELNIGASAPKRNSRPLTLNLRWELRGLDLEWGSAAGSGLASRESSRWGFSGVAHVALGSRDRLSPRCSGLHLFFPCWQRAYLLHRNVPACLELRVHGRAPVGSVSQTPLYGGCELGTYSASCLVTAPLGPGRGGPARGDAFYAAVA